MKGDTKLLKKLSFFHKSKNRIDPASFQGGLGHFYIRTDQNKKGEDNKINNEED